MRLICYPTPPAVPNIQPSRLERGWMETTPNANRCLPLAVANTHGWEMLAPYTITAEWNGGPRPEDIAVWSVGHLESGRIYGHFGAGVLTFDPGCVLRTERDFNLFVTGPINEPKDGIAPLSGVVETDWAPYSFTMNWRFTRPGRVAFRKGEPFCFFFPVACGVVDAVEPEIRPMASDPNLAEAYRFWTEDRMKFVAEVRQPGTEAYKQQWQKRYVRGVLPDGSPTGAAHQTRIRPKPFADRSRG
jgi:hypothetical protein